MKVLFIGHYHQASGFGYASQNYILAMDAASIDIVPRPFFLNGPKCKPHPRIQQLEQKSSQGCDVCIQHVLPHYLQYNQFRKNIALCFLESHGIDLTSWSSHINLMDELWVSCTEVLKHDNGIKIPIKLVPNAFDLEEYNKEYKILDIRQSKRNYKFYYIGEHTKRKNLEATIKAFQLAFSPSEPVSLILKVSIPGLNQGEIIKTISSMCEQIKDSMRLYMNKYAYKTESIIGDYLTRDQILGLHKECDCYVSSSYGECWNLGLWDSLAMGNIALSTDHSAPADYLHPDLLIKSQETICTNCNSFPGIQTSREKWYEISILDLADAMRFCYEMSKQDREMYKDYHKETVSKYSYERVGKIMKGLLI